MVKREYQAVITAAAVAAAWAACARPAPSPPAGETRVFRDDLGRSVLISVEPRRIVCTSPEITEILFALGAEGRVVGVVRGCDWPPEAQSLPVVGDFSNVSLEKVAALKPDLVITTGHEQERIVEQLERLRVPTVVFLASDVASVKRNVEAVGAIVGEKKAAAEIVTTFDEKIAAVASEVKKVPVKRRPRVYLEICPEPLMTVAEGSFVHDAIVLAGGVNVGADLPRPYSRIDAEAVIARDPEVIILCHDAAEAADLTARTGWRGITAVEGGRVYEVDPDLLLRAGPRLADGITLLDGLFYPSRGREGGAGEP
jgi:iron complex transport system substrate-binding protein